MVYDSKIIKFMDLIALYRDNKLNLNPPYQRNSIWTVNSQRLLIDTLRKEWPLPTFFLQVKGNGFEMVDGQQRTRALLAYLDPENGFLDANGNKYSDGEFDNYLITIVELSEKLSMEEIREFYVRVNRSGSRLERPELNKAEHYNKRLLKLSTELSEMIEFRELKVFSLSNIRRMFDRDFIEEIIALILKGPTDKKIAVDQLFKSDITEEEMNMAKTEFKRIMELFQRLNILKPLAETRFTQKNDFYTLFSFLTKHEYHHVDDVLELYKILLKLEEGISPSNVNCPILKEYADNCVTQSNQKRARQRRLEILEAILLNSNSKPNNEQKQVIDFFKLKNELRKIGNAFSLILD